MGTLTGARSSPSGSASPAPRPARKTDSSPPREKPQSTTGLDGYALWAAATAEQASSTSMAKVFPEKEECAQAPYSSFRAVRPRSLLLDSVTQAAKPCLASMRPR